MIEVIHKLIDKEIICYIANHPEEEIRDIVEKMILSDEALETLFLQKTHEMGIEAITKTLTEFLSEQKG